MPMPLSPMPLWAGSLMVAAVVTGLAPAASTAAESDQAYRIQPVEIASPAGERTAMVDGQGMHKQVLDVADARWLRLYFSHIQLPRGGMLRITSLADGAQQTLSAHALAQWKNTSAYFNGGALRLELMAMQGQAAGRYAVAHVRAGQPPAVTEGRCGDDDTRVPSSLPDRARLETIGCAANTTMWIPTAATADRPSW